jgi:hypothetical protein
MRAVAFEADGSRSDVSFRTRESDREIEYVVN